jgi:hypothetical protein
VGKSPSIPVPPIHLRQLKQVSVGQEVFLHFTSDAQHPAETSCTLYIGDWTLASDQTDVKKTGHQLPLQCVGPEAGLPLLGI